MSASEAYTHIVDRGDYSKHRLVPYSENAQAELPQSSIRFRSKILGLTTNNLTYARFGHLMGWYDVYPLPPNTPPPYNDTEKYARIAAWGYAEILESNIPGVSAGQTIYGFLPISSGIEQVCIEPAQHDGNAMANQLIILDEHRQHVWKIYNRVQVCAPLEELEKTKGADSLGWDALMQGLFATSYNMSRYAFAWESQNIIHPSGKGDWSADDADLRGAAVVILNASGKTGMSFAYTLRCNRPLEYQPKTIIGVGSSASVEVIAQSGLYDHAVLNSAAESTASDISQSGARRTLLFDFGAREGVPGQWKTALFSLPSSLTQIAVGGEVCVQDPEKTRKRLAEMSSMVLVNASELREKGIESEGDAYFERFYQAFDEFKLEIVGMKLKWGEGLKEWEQGWEAFCKDEVKANMGLVYRV